MITLFSSVNKIVNLCLFFFRTGIEGPITRQTFVSLIEAFQHGQVCQIREWHFILIVDLQIDFA